MDCLFDNLRVYDRNISGVEFEMSKKKETSISDVLEENKRLIRKSKGVIKELDRVFGLPKDKSFGEGNDRTTSKKLRCLNTPVISPKKDLRAKFLSIYPNLPVPERSQVIVIINNEPCSWNVVYVEVKNNTKLGIRMLEKMHKLELI